MSDVKKVKATSPDWFWVVIEPGEDTAPYRAAGHVITVQAGAYVRTSVPVEDDFPETGDPHADKRWQ